LPFAALVSANGNYFLEEFKISYSPSSNVFLICTENARNKSSFETEKVLSIGNPAFDQKDFSDLKDLPSARNEAEEISKHYFAPKKLLGKDATREAFQSNYKDFEVIHFAGHYVVQPDAPLRSKLVLAKDSGSKENFLTNADLMGDRLTKTKLVVLSACQTGVEGYYNGEGLIGLSRTFLTAGVPLIVSSQWQVDSEASAEIMKKFHYYRRQEKLSTANALRQAQLNMRYEQNGKFQSPYYWAAFASFGGYTNF
jgi:CHAT domain-containing protein